MIHCEEDMTSPRITRGENPSIEQTVYVFSDDEDVSELRAYCIASEFFRRNSPLLTLNLSNTLRLKTIAAQRTGHNQFTFSASYNGWKPKSVQFSRTSGGKTARIKFGTVIDSAGAEGKPAIDYGGGIGFSKGTFEGVDVPVPGSSFTITACYDFEFFTEQYERVLNACRGCVNAQQFGIYAPGECMLMDTSVSKEEETNINNGNPFYYWRIAFQFEGSPNMTDLTNNDTLDPIVKFGHDAYWIDTVTATDPEANRLTKKPVGHYSVRPWSTQWVDFSLLWIPDYRQQYGEIQKYL
ncbi:MAG: hypothetical protein Q4D38_13935 [Planctomycetia bacterium]|nr:hypothetical protein [Planctomycetia bacterium]